MIFGGQTNPGDYHCVAFDENSIRKHLQKAGFYVIEYVEEDIPQDKGFINLNMTVKAIKQVITEQDESNNCGKYSTQNIQKTPVPNATHLPIQKIKSIFKQDTTSGVDGKYLNIV